MTIYFIFNPCFVFFVISLLCYYSVFFFLSFPAFLGSVLFYYFVILPISWAFFYFSFSCWEVTTCIFTLWKCNVSTCHFLRYYLNTFCIRTLHLFILFPSISHFVNFYFSINRTKVIHHFLILYSQCLFRLTQIFMLSIVLHFFLHLPASIWDYFLSAWLAPFSLSLSGDLWLLNSLGLCLPNNCPSLLFERQFTWFWDLGLWLFSFCW